MSLVLDPARLQLPCTSPHGCSSIKHQVFGKTRPGSFPPPHSPSLQSCRPRVCSSVNYLVRPGYWESYLRGAWRLGLLDRDQRRGGVEGSKGPIYRASTGLFFPVSAWLPLGLTSLQSHLLPGFLHHPVQAPPCLLAGSLFLSLCLSSPHCPPAASPLIDLWVMGCLPRRT